MATITEAKEQRIHFWSSLKVRFALSYLVIVVFILTLMNTYFLTSTRDIIFTSKQEGIKRNASLFASTLGADSALTPDRITSALVLPEVVEISDILITNERGDRIYEDRTNGLDDFISQYTPLALGGNDVYYSSFQGGVFSTCAVVPIVNSGKIIGSVFVNEVDKTQGAILADLQSTIKNLSIALSIISIVIVAFTTWTVTRRIGGILKGVVSVREGEHNYQIKIVGNDELALLGREFNRLASRLHSTEEVRRRFVADASHELKTPLAAIRLLSDSIIQNRDMDDETVIEFVTDIGNEAERLARTTERLMSLTRLDSGIVSSPEIVDMRDALLGVLRMLRPIASRQGLSLNTSLDTGCYIAASEDDVYQIGFNLIENAIKYNMPGGSVTVTLRREPHHATFLVEDTGIGIPDKDMPFVFDRFYRVDKARSREAGGSGLGLAIVRDTVTVRRGTVTAAHREGGGTCFQVRFPLSAPPSGAPVPSQHL